VPGVALTYDLCRDAWDRDFNDLVVGYIQWIAERLIYRPNSVSPKVNWYLMGDGEKVVIGE